MAADDSQTFAFKFQEGKPLIYLLDVKTSTTTTLNAGSQTVKPTTSMSTDEIRYRFKLTPAKNSHADVMTVFYKPYHFEIDGDLMNSSGHYVTSLRDLQARGTQNGILLFDSAKGVATASAKKFRNEMVTLFLSGYMDFDRAGNLKETRGDLPFVDHWSDSLKDQVGFFGLIFPEHAVAVDGSWQKIISVKNAGAVKLDDELSYTNIVTRDPDTLVAGKTVATFKVVAPLDAHDLTGYFEQPGQNTSMQISQFTRTGSGTLHFDQSRGVLIDSKIRATSSCVMNSLFQGRSTTVSTDAQSDMQITLLDESATDAKP